MIKHLPALPSIGPHVTGAPVRDAAPDVSAKSTPSGLLGKITKLLEDAQVNTATRPKDNGPRDPVIRDPQRTRDATSLGTQRAGLSGLGVGLAGAALGAGGSLKLQHDTKRLPITVSPFFTLGGGGMRIGTRF